MSNKLEQLNKDIKNFLLFGIFAEKINEESLLHLVKYAKSVNIITFKYE